jgi:hypothetical protein
MISKLFFLGILSLLFLASAQAKVIETERDVDITGTIDVDKASGPSEGVKGEKCF